MRLPESLKVRTRRKTKTISISAAHILKYVKRHLFIKDGENQKRESIEMSLRDLYQRDGDSLGC